MKLEQLLQQRGTLLLNESAGLSVLKLGIGTLYVHWIFLNGKYKIDFISGDPQGKEKLVSDDELNDWVLQQLYQQQPAKAA